MSYQVTVPVLVGLAVMCVGGGVLLSIWLKRMPIRARLRQVGGSAALAGEPDLSPSRLAELAGNVGNAVSSRRTSSQLRERLSQAGYHAANAATVYLGLKMILLLMGLFVTAALLLPLDVSNSVKTFLALSVGVGLFLVPNMVVNAARSKRRQEVRGRLPDAMDLLEVCASAGMGLDMAWNSVTDEVRGVSVVLADEMALTNLEIHLGATRANAMRHMARRTGAEELSSLVAVLVQSERFGTSIAEALRNFAMAMREARSFRAQELAEKMSVKLIFPMLVFIFPALVLVMVGPAILALMGALK